MPNQRLASRYAKSLLDLAVEQKTLEAVYADIKAIAAACKNSRELVNLLQSPIVNADKKTAVMQSIATTAKFQPLTFSFIKLLINKNRESDLPYIAQGFIDLYNHLKGIHTVKLTTAVAISESIQQAIVNKVQQTQNFKAIELETVVDEKLIGGFVLEFDGKIVDASILHDLKSIKKQFENNDYVMRMY